MGERVSRERARGLDEQQQLLRYLQQRRRRGWIWPNRPFLSNTEETVNMRIDSNINQHTSIIIANGTQHATAQQIPSNAMTTVADATVLTKNVLIIASAYSTNAPVQIFRNMNGIVGNFNGLPSRAASARHCLTSSRTRTSSASAAASGFAGSTGSSGSRRR